MEKIIIRLVNGVIEAEWNQEDNTILSDPFDPSIMEDLSIINIFTGNATMILHNMAIKYLGMVGDKVHFTFQNKMSKEQSEITKMQSDIDYLSMMTGYSL